MKSQTGETTWAGPLSTPAAAPGQPLGFIGLLVRLRAEREAIDQVIATLERLEGLLS